MARVSTASQSGARSAAASVDELARGVWRVWQRAQHAQFELVQGLNQDFALLSEESGEAATIQDQVALQLAFAGEVFGRLIQASLQGLDCMLDAQRQQAIWVEATFADLLAKAQPVFAAPARTRAPRPLPSQKASLAEWPTPWQQGLSLWQDAVMHDLEAEKEASA